MENKINLIKVVMLVIPIPIVGLMWKGIEMGLIVDRGFLFLGAFFVFIGFFGIWYIKGKLIPQSIFLLCELNLSVWGVFILLGFIPQL